VRQQEHIDNLTLARSEAAGDLGRSAASGDPVGNLAIQRLARGTGALGGGQPLDTAVRGRMERHLGHDFSSVRLQAGAEGDRVARAAGAVGVTVGENIWLGAGQSVDSLQGQLVLAHELAHVVQQRRGGDVPPVSSSAAHEADATTAAIGVALGRPVSVGAATGVGVARFTPEELARMVQLAEEQWRAANAYMKGPGVAGEGAYQGNLLNQGIFNVNLNDLRRNAAHLDVVSSSVGVTQVKTGGDFAGMADVLRKLANPELDTRTVGGEARAEDAARLLLKNRTALESPLPGKNAWPDALKNLDSTLPEEQQVAEVLKFFKKDSVLAVPSDQVDAVRAKVIEEVLDDPARWGLKKGPNLKAEAEALAQRVHSIGLKQESLESINRDLRAGKVPGTQLNEPVTAPAPPQSHAEAKKSPKIVVPGESSPVPHESAPPKPVVPGKGGDAAQEPVKPVLPGEPATPRLPTSTVQSLGAGLLSGIVETGVMAFDDKKRTPLEFGARVARAAVAGTIAAGATAMILPLLPAAASNPVGLTVAAGFLIGTIVYGAVTGSWDFLEDALVSLLGGHKGGPPVDVRALDRLYQDRADRKRLGLPEPEVRPATEEEKREFEENEPTEHFIGRELAYQLEPLTPSPPPPRKVTPPPPPPPAKTVTPPPTPKGCFVGATRVRLADGTSREIQNVKVGDEVLAFHERSGQLRPGRVTYLHVHPPEPCIRVLVDGDTTVRGVTSSHPVRSASKWVPAGTLSCGAFVERFDATGTALMAVPVMAVEPGCEDEPVYNLTVDECESYFADGILVHNSSLEVPKRKP
jgi:hypothetical protein